MHTMFVQAPIDRMLVDSKSRSFLIVQQSGDSQQTSLDIEYREVEDDLWRVGRLQPRPDDGPEDVMTLDFAVLIPEDEEESVMQRDEPPLLWDVPRTQ